MKADEKTYRLRASAVRASGAMDELEASLECLVAVPRLNWQEINRAANAANLALRQLRALYAIEIGRAWLGDEVEEQQPLAQPGKGN